MFTKSEKTELFLIQRANLLLEEERKTMIRFSTLLFIGAAASVANGQCDLPTEKVQAYLENGEGPPSAPNTCSYGPDDVSPSAASAEYDYAIYYLGDQS